MARIELRLPPELVDALEAHCPRTQTLPKFCAQLLEEHLTRVRTLPAYRVGAGNPGHLTTKSGSLPEDYFKAADMPALSPHLEESTFLPHTHLEDGVGKGLSGETPRQEPLRFGEGLKTDLIPAAKLGKVRLSHTKGTPEFEAFWKQYQAIKRRASGQSKPKAWAIWQDVTETGITAEQLSKALGAAVTQQNQVEREGGHASPFPDCFRWLRDGYYEAFMDAASAAVALVQRPDFTPPAEFPDAPF